MAVGDVLASGWVAQGPKVAVFEAAVCAALGAAHGVATTSCTTALHLALHALGVGPGDEVVVPSLSFIATTNAPRYVGARPVFADVDLETQNLTAETVERALGPSTRAVIVVHQAGMPADVDAIAAVCAPRGVAVDRGRRVRDRLDVPRPARRGGRQPRGAQLPSAQAPHHRRGRHAADERRGARPAAAAPARARHGASARTSGTRAGPSSSRRTRSSASTTA